VLSGASGNPGAVQSNKSPIGFESEVRMRGMVVCGEPLPYARLTAEVTG
jgi:hypothetical protein